jgi:hypothetical protein
MRIKRIKVAAYLVLIIAVSMFFYGFFDTEVTAFLTIKVKYGISLFILTLLYSYSLYLQYKNERYKQEIYDAPDEWTIRGKYQEKIDELEESKEALRREHLIETSRLLDTIIKIKSNVKKNSTNRRKPK